jgi:hypothetical protein
VSILVCIRRVVMLTYFITVILHMAGARSSFSSPRALSSKSSWVHYVAFVNNRFVVPQVRRGPCQELRDPVGNIGEGKQSTNFSSCPTSSVITVPLNAGRLLYWKDTGVSMHPMLVVFIAKFERRVKHSHKPGMNIGESLAKMLQGVGLKK